MDESQKPLEIKVGLFVFIGLAVIAVMTVVFGRMGEGFKKYYQLTVELPNASGILDGSDVQLAGARIGHVSGKPRISQSVNSVAVDLKIYENIKIPRQTNFQVGSSGLLGDRFIEVVTDPAFNPEKFDPNDSTQIWHPGETAKGVRAGGLDELTRKGGEVMDQLSAEITDLRVVTESIRSGVLSEKNLKNLEATFSNLQTTSASFVDTSKSLQVVVENAKGTVETANKTLGTVDSAATDLRKVLDSARAVLRKASEGEGVIPALLNNREMLENLKALIANLRQRGVLFYRDAKPPAAAPGSRNR
jgi:phospholipid/cholesterol/gamma-HCH transport system substrate-binding protein